MMPPPADRRAPATRVAGTPARLEPFVPLLAAAPGLAQVRAAGVGAPVAVFHGPDRVPAPEVLRALASRALLVADAGAARAMRDAGTAPDVVCTGDPETQTTEAGVVVGPPEAHPPAGGTGARSVLLLPPGLAWLAQALGHGPVGEPDAAGLLLAALALGPGPALWAGPRPHGWDGLLAGVVLAEPDAEVLVEAGSPAWYEGQGCAELEVVAVAWPAIDRASLLARVNGAIRAGPSARTDLLPGRVVRASLPPTWRGGDWVRDDHEAWLRLAWKLHAALREGGRLQEASAEADKYRSFWATGRFRGHTSPGERVYPVVRDFVRALGCRTLLDVGCGAGEVLEAAARDGLDVFGLDIADGLSGTGRARFRERLALGYAWSLPLADGSADFVFSSDVLEHLPPSRIPATLDEIARVCARGGALAISARADFTGLRWGALLHLSVFPLEYWQSELERRFDVPYAVEAGRGLNPHHILLFRRRA